MFDGENRFAAHFQGTFQKQVVDANDGASERVFDRDQKGVCKSFVDGPERDVERGTRNGCDRLAEKLNGRSFAESSRFTLKGDAHFAVVQISHRRRKVAQPASAHTGI